MRNFFYYLPLYFILTKGIVYPGTYRETPTPYVGPDTKKSCPPRRRQEKFFALGPETWKED